MKEKKPITKIFSRILYVILLTLIVIIFTPIFTILSDKWTYNEVSASLYWVEWVLTRNTEFLVKIQETAEIINNTIRNENLPLILQILCVIFIILIFWLIISSLILIITTTIKHYKNHKNKNNFSRDMEKYNMSKKAIISYIRFPWKNIQFSAYDNNIEYISDEIPINSTSKDNENFSVLKWGIIKINWQYLKRWDSVTVHINSQNPKDYRIDTSFLCNK